jgi:hypothetical protein
MSNEIKIGDIRTMSREDLESSFKEERDWILAQAWQLLVDVKSANDRFADNPVNIHFYGFQELLEMHLASRNPCPYFEIHKARADAGWL